MTRVLASPGRVSAVDALGIHISFDSPCSGCACVCYGSRASEPARKVVIPARYSGEISGRMGERVELSVSQRGFTWQYAVVFFPATAIKAAVMVVSSAGASGFVVSGLVLAGLAGALVFSARLAPRAEKSLDPRLEASSRTVRPPPLHG